MKVPYKPVYTVKICIFRRFEKYNEGIPLNYEFCYEFSEVSNFHPKSITRIQLLTEIQICSVWYNP